ncbi:MAG: glycosyl hydrolase [Acidobacteria bacterium]|nr:glycosyl hydrolase [Acidobacteriota bacterium]
MAAASLASAATAPDLYKDIKYRLIGPFRGGRSIAVAGVASQPFVYYFGATGGGVWKTVDAGAHWEAISDAAFKTGSVGSITVAPSDPNIIYVGMGEGCIRGNAAHGDGVYKSTDAGKTWKHMGLADTQQIGRVRVHPRNPDTVWVAALGHMSGPNDERGVFKSTDGGKTWRRTLFKSAKAGAIDLMVDPSNADVLYASIWETVRKPWTMESGGPDSGLWKSTDGGETWTDISRNPGLPKGVLGRIGITVSPAAPERLWAIVEAEDGGVYRSDNAGKTWTRVNDERNLRQRAWYYTHIYADPLKSDTVYVLNTGFYRSNDGGRTFVAIPTMHGDNHDLWIAPDNPERMIEANDGGANITMNGGKSWSTVDNQPTAQFYRVALDQDFPFNIYGAQQDNTTVRIASRGKGGSITERDWWDVGGGESGWMAPDPRDSNIVYAGSYDGLLTRYDHRTGALRNVTIWPDNTMGAGADAAKYRFQWNYPLLFSPHDPTKLYAAANVLFESVDEGHSWKPISGDLTRNDRSKQGPSGGPITKDNTSVEYYDTIFTVAESSLEKGLIWTGSDDGLVHVTRDGGKHWSNVTPPDLPEWSQINSIEASPHDPATAYLAATLYKLDDFRPLLYKTADYGKSWTRMVDGISRDAFTRVVREDPNQRGVLAAGTETGVYISYDSGAHWLPFNLNIPAVPITDLAFHKRDDALVVATEGRSFYVLDDLATVRQIHGVAPNDPVRLFAPSPAIRALGGGGFGGTRGAAPVGQNPASGVVLHYWLKEKPAGEVTLEFLDSAGKLVKRVSSKGEPVDGAPAADDDDDDGPRRPRGAAKAPAEQGMNRFVWNMRYPDATGFPGLIMWAGQLAGPLATPGAYQVRLTANGQTVTQRFEIRKDPRATATAAEFEAQLALLLQLRDKVSQANSGVVRIRDARRQLEPYTHGDNKAVAQAAADLIKKLTAVEQELYQTRNKASQDPLNFPIRLNNKLAALMGTVAQSDRGPTEQSQRVFEDLATRTNAQLSIMERLMKNELSVFNRLVREQNVPAVVVKPGA